MDGLIDRAESKEVVLLFARSLLCASLAGYKVARPRFVIDPFLPRETHTHIPTYAMIPIQPQRVASAFAALQTGDIAALASSDRSNGYDATTSTPLVAFLPHLLLVSEANPAFVKPIFRAIHMLREVS